MKNSKRFLIAAISTIIFTVLSKRFAGIPCMSLKQFDLSFAVSFLLWVFYSASLFLAGNITYDRNIDFIKISGSGFLFGILSAFLKTGIDSIIMVSLGETANLILLTFVMEMDVLLWGSLIMIVAYFMLPKRKFAWDQSANRIMAVLACSMGIYTAAFLSFNAKFQSIPQFTELRSFAGNETIYLNALMEMDRILRYGSAFTMLSTVLSAVFFIGLWLIFEKSSNEKR